MNIKKKKIISEMQRRGITQKGLSEIAGISRQTINGICKGRECSVATAYKIAQALGVPLYELEERGRG